MDQQRAWTGLTPEEIAERAAQQQISLPTLFPGAVYIEAARVQQGADGPLIFLRVRTSDGQLARATIAPAELEAALGLASGSARLAPKASTSAALVSPQDLYLLVEASRIRLA